MVSIGLIAQDERSLHAYKIILKSLNHDIDAEIIIDDKNHKITSELVVIDIKDRNGL
ncbi:MAG: hypothetical protein JXQ66_07910 [Campylobacterales bacterium]|nr:hypothetical protein [Campylobacterales bacterium]